MSETGNASGEQQTGVDELGLNQEQRAPETHASLAQLLGGSASFFSASSAQSSPLTNGRSSSLPLPASLFSSLPLPSPSSQQQHHHHQHQLSKFLSPAGIVPYSSHLRSGELGAEFGSTSLSRRKQEFQQSMQSLTDAVQRVVGTPQSADEELKGLRAELQAHENNRIQAQKAYDDLLRAYQEQRGKNAELMEELARMNDELVRARAALRTHPQTSELRSSLDLSGFSFVQPPLHRNDDDAAASSLGGRHQLLAVDEGIVSGAEELTLFGEISDDGEHGGENIEEEGEGFGEDESVASHEGEAKSGDDNDEHDDDDDDDNANQTQNENNANQAQHTEGTEWELRTSEERAPGLLSNAAQPSSTSILSLGPTLLATGGDTDELATQDLLQTSELVESFFQQATNRMGELETTIHRQSEEIEGLRQREAALLTDQLRLRESIARLQTEHQQAVERLEAEQGQYVEQIEDLQEKNQEAKDFSDQLVRELASLKIVHRTTLQKLTHAEGQVGAVHLRNEQTNQAAQLLRDEISTLNRERKAREALFRSQEEELAQQRGFAAELQAELQSSAARADALEETLKATQQQLRAKEQELSELGRNKQSIMGHISRLKNQVSTRMSASSVSALPLSSSSLSTLDTSLPAASSSSASASSFASMSSSTLSPHSTVTSSLPLFSPIVPLPPSRKPVRTPATTPFHARQPTSRPFDQLLPTIPSTTIPSTIPTTTPTNIPVSAVDKRSPGDQPGRS